MDGKEFAKMIERELADRGIRKGDFYNEIGISATAMYGWKRGAVPSAETVAAVENYFGKRMVSGAPQMDAETENLLQLIRERQDLKILLHSGKDLPASSVYEIVAKMEKMKEDVISD